MGYCIHVITSVSTPFLNCGLLYTCYNISQYTYSRLWVTVYTIITLVSTPFLNCGLLYTCYNISQYTFSKLWVTVYTIITLVSTPFLNCGLLYTFYNISQYTYSKLWAIITSMIRIIMPIQNELAIQYVTVTTITTMHHCIEPRSSELCVKHTQGVCIRMADLQLIKLTLFYPT